MELPSKLFQDMSWRFPPYCLIVDSVNKTFCLATRRQLETMRDESTYIRLLMSRMKRLSSGIYDFLFPQQVAVLSSSITSLGWQLDWLTMTSARSLIVSLKLSSYSQKNFDSALLKSLA